MSVKPLNWNLEFVTAKWEAQVIRCRIDEYAVDVICLTETDIDRLSMPSGGHVPQTAIDQKSPRAQGGT